MSLMATPEQRPMRDGEENGGKKYQGQWHLVTARERSQSPDGLSQNPKSETRSLSQKRVLT